MRTDCIIWRWSIKINWRICLCRSRLLKNWNVVFRIIRTAWRVITRSIWWRSIRVIPLWLPSTRRRWSKPSRMRIIRLPSLTRIMNIIYVWWIPYRIRSINRPIIVIWQAIPLPCVGISAMSVLNIRWQPWCRNLCSWMRWLMYKPVMPKVSKRPWKR